MKKLFLLLCVLSVFGCDKQAGKTPNNADAVEEGLVEVGKSEEANVPVKWVFYYKALGNDEYELHYKANLDGGWYIYSQHLEHEDGPLPTTLTLNNRPGLSSVGEISEKGDKVEGFDETFGMNIVKFKSNVTFVQHIALSDKSQPITGTISYMTCDNTRCLPPKDISFSFVIK